MSYPQSTAYTAVFKAYLASDHVTPATGKTIAITLSKAGGAFGNPSAGASNATEISGGWYSFAFSTTDTGTLGDLVLKGAEATIDTVERIFPVVNANNGGMLALPNAAAEAAGGLYTRGTGAGQIKQTNNGEVDTNATRINGIATTTVATVQKNIGLPDAQYGTIPTTGAIATAGDEMTLTADYDAAKTAASQASVDDVKDKTDDLNFDSFGVQASTQNLKGNIDGGTGQMTVWSTRQDGSDIPSAADNFASVLTTQLTEAYAADGTAPTLAQALFLIQQSLHEFSISGTSRTVKKIDGSTTAAVFTLDDATNPTATTRSA